MNQKIIQKALCALIIMVTSALAWEKNKPATPPVIPPNPKQLPQVLLVGDSISAGYFPLVAKAIDGKAIVAKSSDNGESTTVGVLKIDGWLGNTKWDVIHFNWGVWDMYGWQYATDDRSPAAYAQRLDTLVTRMKKTGAKLIWATTTPVPPKPEATMLKRWKTEVVISPELERQYQDAALQVMKKHDVAINDLHALLKPRQKEYQAEDNVHFSQAASGLMAKQVAESITKVLGAAPATAATGTGEARFIDAHVHFHDTKAGDLEKVDEWMKANNVQRIINHPLRQSRAKDDKERARQVDNYKAYTGRMARFCIIFPDEVSSVDEAVAILEREKKAGAVGFGEHYGEVSNPQKGDKSLFFDDPKNMVLFAACEKAGLPLMFHMDRGRNLDEKGFPRLQNALKAFPKLVFIAHSDWWRSITDGTCGQLLETYPNLYADISCTVGRSPIGRDRAMAREFFIKHADKLLFGTDSGWWSLGKDKKQAGEFALIDELKLPHEAEEKICRKNAEKLFWGKSSTP